MADNDTMAAQSDLAAKLRFDVPHAARIWNYWMGGKDNFEADRAAGDAVADVYPDIVTMALQSRRFLIRVVDALAGELGIKQFLDVGTGLPTMQNTHEIAQRNISEARIVYVDNDPLVLTHARALLVNTTPEGVTTYVDADMHEPEVILNDARNVLNFNEPVAVMFMGVLGYVETFDEMHRIVRSFIDAIPSGSYLVIWDGTNTGNEITEGGEKLAESGAVPYNLRSPEEIRQLFSGLELLEPGLVPMASWRPGADQDEPIDAYGAVGRKP
ncbi:SAM-dependent methyltransferase [Phytoactinopolyspora limicola]|uniref:SAM-dependent methyltransferase n=1 Tax=Phytoactinopolyspora limicola TaxID=2715536 RepID=UPI001A9C9622|nr:SAM-dependent methyltransferase [Phytoactinopolyspora limicola]